jgi:tRNA modification GTPase
MQRARLIAPGSGELLDEGLAVWFPAPASFTGEDVAELHLHGGRAIVASVLDALGHLEGLRAAEPGEFTKRAFLNEKLDLTQAEALADAIDAETQAQARQALRQMGGALKERYDAWRQRLVHALAHLEAVIDFPDEDLPTDVANKVWPEIAALETEIAAHLIDDARGERIREGLRIAILGPPNAGKSTLLNWLARREAAIVSAEPGTTRDVIEVHLDLGGYAVTVIDTAGLREASDAIEREGVRRAQAQARDADLKIVLLDATTGEIPPEMSALIDENAIVVANKSDALTPDTRIIPAQHFVSVRTGAALEHLMNDLQGRIARRFEVDNAAPLSRPRHRRGLEECIAALERARAAPEPELAVEDIRLAARALGRLTGRIEVDEILDVVFRDFCIGK